MADEMGTVTAVDTHAAIRQARREVAAQGLTGELDSYLDAFSSDYAKVRVLFAEREAAQPTVTSETAAELVARLSRGPLAA